MIRLGDTKPDKEGLDLLVQAYNSGFWSPGALCKQFEEKFARLHDSKYAILVNSGTDALRIALAAAKEFYGWQDGDEVLVPAVTFVATVNTVLQVGLKPVLVDVGIYDYAINPERMAISTTERTRAVIVVHPFGQPAELDALELKCKDLGLVMIEDSCEAMGVRFKDQSVGSFGVAAAFSTYSCHLLASGAGGVVTTSDPNIYQLCLSFANHGRDPAFIPNLLTHKADLNLDFLRRRFKFDYIGYSARATEFQAAVLIPQLPQLPEIVSKRRENADYLIDALRDLQPKALALPTVCRDRTHGYMMFPIVLSGIVPSKWDVCLALEQAGIETREMLPIIGQPCYQRIFPYGSDFYPMAKIIGASGFYIPSHQFLTRENLDLIVDVLRRELLPKNSVSVDTSAESR